MWRMIIYSSDLLEVNFCFCAVVLRLMLAECPTFAPLVAYRSPLVFLPVFILKFIPSHFFILEEINFMYVIFFPSSTKSSFIRCYTRINCQVTLIGCVWQSVSKHKGCPGSLLFSELSSSFHRTVWSWCSSRPKLSLSPPCRSLTETSTILWWAARTAPSTWHVVMEGGSLPPSTVGGETVAAFLTHLGPSVNVAHSPPSVAQFQHSISCWLRFRSCPVILFFFSACQLCLQRSTTINRAHMRGETNHSFPVHFIFLLCVFLWAREFVYAWSSQGD